MIDSHHHFWRYDPEEYGWISESMAVLRRDYLPADLLREASAAGVDGVVSVQARQTLEETRWLIELAEQNDFIRGVVGWVPLVSDAVRQDLERFAVHPKLKAVRHVLQDEPDDNYILRDDFNRGITLLNGFGLRYDILIFERHLPQTIEFVDRHPSQVFVLDHIAKPRLRENAHSLEPWASGIKELAKRENVSCKVSGMVTEADWAAWSGTELKPYFDTVLEAFGPNRLMFGSDWPVCLVASGYGRWFDAVTAFARNLSPSEQEALFGGTATAIYRL